MKLPHLRPGSGIPPILVEVRLPDDQLVKLAELIATRIGGDSRRPLTVPKAAERLGVSAETIRLRVKAGLIRSLPASAVGSRMLIPVVEIERLLNPSTPD